MKSFSLVVLLALVKQSGAFVGSSVSKRTFLIGAPSCSIQQKPLCVTTELTAESVGQSSDDNDGAAEQKAVDDVPVAVEAVANESPAKDTSAEQQAKPVGERVRHTLFVGNLPFESDEESVRALLSEFGEVKLVALPRNKDSGKPRGFVFVDMATKEEMEAAIQGVNGRLLDGRVLRASPSLPKDEQPKKSDADNGMGKVYVGNISYTTTNEMLVDHFKQYGNVFEVYMPTTSEGESRGYAFVTMKNDELESVIERANGVELDGREISVTLPLPRGEKPQRKARQQQQDRTKIYVGNLSFYTIQETLEEVFSEFGDIIDCYIPPDPSTGSSRGFGFVTMAPEDAQRAIAELDSCELDGRIIRVNEAQPKGEKRQSKRGEKNESDDEY